jgi:hypothetical protein
VGGTSILTSPIQINCFNTIYSIGETKEAFAGLLGVAIDRIRVEGRLAPDNPADLQVTHQEVEIKTDGLAGVVKLEDTCLPGAFHDRADQRADRLPAPLGDDRAKLPGRIGGGGAVELDGAGADEQFKQARVPAPAGYRAGFLRCPAPAAAAS